MGKENVCHDYSHHSLCSANATLQSLKILQLHDVGATGPVALPAGGVLDVDVLAIGAGEAESAEHRSLGGTWKRALSCGDSRFVFKAKSIVRPEHGVPESLRWRS